MKNFMQDTNGKFLFKIFILFGVLTLGVLNQNQKLDNNFISPFLTFVFQNQTVIAD